MLCGPLSYEFSQFRISEALNLLVFFNPTYTIGLTLGCFLANIMSTVGPLDMVLGTSATLISCLIIVFLSKLIKNLFVASLIPTIVNAIIVPITIWLSCLGTGDEFLLGDMFWIMAGWVALGEFVCITGFGYPLVMAFTKTKVRDSFYKLIEATRNLDFKW
jgi:uncharacterized membrane protein